LITCYDDNFASIRVIEKNHGILKDKIEIDWLDKIVRRYIVKL